MAAGEDAPAGDLRHLQSVLTLEELSKISKIEAVKINEYIDSKHEEYMRAKALLETEKYRMKSKIAMAEEKNTELSLMHKNTLSKLTSAEEKIVELQLKVNVADVELEKSQEKSTSLKQEIETLKKMSEIALDEKNEMLRALERQTEEFKRLKTLVENSSSELHVARKENCEVLSVNHDFHNKELTLRQNEKKLEQERETLNAKVSFLTEELNRATTDLQSANCNFDLKIRQLESNLTEINEKLNTASATVNQLTQEKGKLQEKNDELTQKVSDQSSLAHKLSTNFSKELDLKAKQSDMYKTLHNNAEMKALELSEAITTLQKLLDEGTERYGILETKLRVIETEHQSVLEKKDENISSLEAELVHANELITSTNNNTDSNNESTIPNELSGMTITQMYAQLKKVTEELTKERDECQRLNKTINDVVSEVESKVPNLEKAKENLDKALESKKVLTQELDSWKMECSKLKNDLSEATQKIETYSNENFKLKLELEDLSHQICFLLHKAENNQNKSLFADANLSLHSSSSENLLSKSYTFSDIQELQANNIKLIQNIRELSEKHDHLKKLKEEFDSADYQNKVKLLEQKVNELTQTQERQTISVTELIRQRDLYKKLCEDNPSVKEIENTDSANTKNVLEDKLKATEEQLEELKKEYNEYKETKEVYEKKLKHKFHGMQQQIANMKASNEITTTHTKGQIEYLQGLIAAHVKNIQNLENDKVKFNSIITKHELSITNLKLELQKATQKITSSQSIAEKYRLECNRILDTQKKQFTENNVLLEGQLTNQIFSQNLELIKRQLESHKDSYTKLESRYQDVKREAEIARQSLEEEEKQFSEAKSKLINEVETYKLNLLNEKKITDALRIELAELKKNLPKMNRTDTSTISNDITSKMKELENAIVQKDNEIKTLQDQLGSSKETIKTYCDISENAEQGLRTLQDEYTNYKSDFEQKVNDYTEKIQTLEDRCAELEAELSLQSTEDSSTTAALKDEVMKTVNQLKEMEETLSKCKTELSDALLEKSQLFEKLQALKQQYEQAMVLHGDDMKQLDQYKEDVAKLQNELQNVISLKDNIVSDMEFKEMSWKDKEQLLLKETEELQTQISDLNTLRSLLLDQLQSVSVQLSIQRTSMTDGGNEATDNSNVDTSTDSNVAICTEQLHDIITFMRKDKDATSAKCLALQSELSRLKIQLKITQEQLHNTKLQLDENKNNFDIKIMRNIDHNDIVSENNKYLDSERKSLKIRIGSLSDSVKTLEEKLSHLQEMNSNLKSKNDNLEAANESLKDEVARWKKNIKSNVDRASKSNAEDCKRLQSERDQLIKSLNAEKESVKKLIEEVGSAKREKIKIDEEYSTLTRQHAMVVDDHKRINLELQKVQGNMTKMKKELATKTQINSKLTNELKEKEAALNQARTKEQHMWKFAQKYKAQYDDIAKTNVTSKNSEETSDDGQLTEMQSQLDSEKANLDKLKSDLESSIEKEHKAKQLLKAAKTKIFDLTEARNALARELQESQAKIDTFEQDERITLIKTEYEVKISKLEKEECEKAKEIEGLMQKIELLQRQLTNQPSTKPLNIDKPANEPPTANIKPMSSSGSGSTGNSRRSGEPPLASIRPVAQVQAMPDTHSTEYMPASSSRPLQEEAHPPPQTIALVMPRVETPAAPGVSTSHTTAEPRVLKRPHPPPTTLPDVKKTRVDEEVQLPTSSQRDQEDEDVIVVESDDECMGTEYQEEGEEDEEASDEEDEDDDDDDDDDDDQEGVDEEEEVEEDSSEEEDESAAPQIEAISSGTEPSGALSLGGGDDGDGDDGIVPSTPTLYVPRRNDGFGEAVVSPLSGADGARFTFTQTHHHSHADLAAAMPPALPEDWNPAVTSQTHQVIEDDREAEATLDESQRNWPSQEESDHAGRADESTY